MTYTGLDLFEFAATKATELKQATTKVSANLKTFSSTVTESAGNLIRVSTAKLGFHRNSPRVYLQGKYLSEAGFKPSSRIKLQYSEDEITLELCQFGEKKVSSKTKNGEPISVIDILSKRLSDSLGEEGFEVRVYKQKIVLRPDRIARLKKERVASKSCGSVFAGGGLLSLAAKEAGYTEEFGIEIDPAYADVYADNFPESRLFNQSVHEVNTDDLTHVDLLLMGIPCEPYSKARRSGAGYNKGAVPEAHELGDMTFWALRVVDAVNPCSVVIEEAPDYLSSGAGWLLVHTLERMGYTLWSDVLNAADYGSLQNRTRSVIVAHSGKFTPPSPSASRLSLSDIFEEAEILEWFNRESKGWLFDHWDRQAAKGNNFGKNVILTEKSSKVPAIKKRYLAQQGDNPVVQHPDKPGMFRWFTLAELRRLFEISDFFKLNVCKTKAGEIIGQGVVVGLFTQIIQGIGQ